MFVHVLFCGVSEPVRTVQEFICVSVCVCVCVCVCLWEGVGLCLFWRNGLPEQGVEW